MRSKAIGVVTEIDPHEQVAFIDPDPSVASAVVRGLDFGDAGEGDIEVPADSAATELRVARDL